MLNDVYNLLISSDNYLLSKIHHNSKRLSGIINSIDINLIALTRFQLLSAIEERLDLYNKNPNKKKLLPFSQQLLYHIYFFTGKDLRETFKILQYICHRTYSLQEYIHLYHYGDYEVSYSDGIDYIIEYSEKIYQRNQFDILDRERLAKIYKSRNIAKLDCFEIKLCSPEELNIYLNDLVKINLLTKDIADNIYFFKPTLKFEMLAIAKQINTEIRELALNKFLSIDPVNLE